MTRHYTSTVSGAEIRQRLIAAGLLVPRDQVQDRLGAGLPCMLLDDEGCEAATKNVRDGLHEARRAERRRRRNGQETPHG